MEAKYQRLLGSSLEAFSLFISMLPKDQHVALYEDYRVIFKNPKFWKFGKHSLPTVSARSASWKCFFYFLYWTFLAPCERHSKVTCIIVFLVIVVVRHFQSILRSISDQKRPLQHHIESDAVLPWDGRRICRPDLPACPLHPRRVWSRRGAGALAGRSACCYICRGKSSDDHHRT